MYQKMVKKCAICSLKIKEYSGKLLGTMLKITNLRGKKAFIHVCSDCQNLDNWIEKAKVRSA